MGIVLIAALAGVALGVGVAVTLARASRRPVVSSDPAIAQQLDRLEQLQQQLAATQAQQLQGSIDTLVTVAGEKFADQSAMATQALDLRQQSISQQFAEVSDELVRMRELVTNLQNQHAQQHGQVTAGIRQAIESSAALADTAQSLREVLASTKARGQWGERMADDVLRLSGFVEGVNYRKQTAIAGGGIPDFTFLLPRERVVHMDVKFPLDNYLRAHEADSPADRERFERAFLKDVRDRVGELGGRSYIDPDSTVDAVLLFIPNESIYGFVHQADPGLADLALSQRVVLCSPFTLFAVLAVIRQAVDAFVLDRTSDEILSCLGSFTGQWQKFSDALDLVGKRFDSTQKAFDDLAGTRRRQLQKTLDHVEALRNRRGLAEADGPDAAADDELPVERDLAVGEVPQTVQRLRPVRLG